MWLSREVQLPALPRGIHSITTEVVAALPELSGIASGTLHIFLLHTSASLTINENADPDVLRDLDQSLDALAPESSRYRHDDEGPDDMPGHIKSSLLGCSLTVPVYQGRLHLGTWQGICLCEHRRRAGRRRIMLTLCGQARS